MENPSIPSPTSVLLSELASAISSTSQSAAFTLGGSIPIASSSDAESRFANITTDTSPLTSPRVVIRWDLPSGKAIRKLTLPVLHAVEEEDTKGETTPAIAELLKDCEPATFGHKGKEVLDETYRQAVKLDESQFCTSFNPYDVGIVDAVAQTLLPAVASGGASGGPRRGLGSLHVEELKEHWGVAAELYKLNVYSGPSGLFRSHVDTPRGATQFGSLVVCLPHPHQGGQLRVAHKGQEMVYDWSNESADTIEWAAFYSDCEHEVKQVQSGHRVTLTYNLYVNERLGGVLRQNPAVRPNSYPLFQMIEKMLKARDFLPQGGSLGFNCAHAYAHTNERYSARLPFALKGVDVVVYAVFRALGLQVNIHPVLEHIEDEEVLSEDDEDSTMDPDEKQRGKGELVGTDLHSLAISEQGGTDEWSNEKKLVEWVWESERCSDIHWLNEPGPKETAVVCLTYGNQPGIAWHYSYATILVDIPSFRKRTVGMARMKPYEADLERDEEGEEEAEDAVGGGKTKGDETEDEEE